MRTPMRTGSILPELIGVVIEKSRTKHTDMKPIMNYLKLVYTVLAVTFFQAVCIAQESTGGSSSTTKVEITADTGNWFSNNWIWVVGAIVFIILLFALIGGGGSSRRTTVVREDTGTGRVTRTTTVDDDI
jgi:formate-dependent nitrite reductase membrane component NrfD